MIAEWSFAWPGSGMETDWSVLLTSDFSFDVVAAASLVGPAGSVPTGLAGVVEFAVSEIVGFLGVVKFSFLQPISKTDAIVTASKMFDFFMGNSSMFYKKAINVFDIDQIPACPPWLRQR